jgi:preprotein translocase SecE subunit
MPIFNYFKETRAELRHVAWPTQTQTIVYTILVAGISLFIALYLGFFDFLFTSTMARLAGVQTAEPTKTQSQTPATTTPVFNPGSTNK